MAKSHAARGADPSGPGQRQQRVAELIRAAVAEVLQRGDLHEPGLAKVVVTVPEVRMSPDLKLATVYVMPLGGQDVEGTLKALDRVKGELRTEVARRVNLKFAPQLRFRRDESADEAQRVARLLASPAVRRDLDAAPRGPEDDAPDGAPDDTPTPLDRTSPGDDHGETR